MFRTAVQCLGVFMLAAALHAAEFHVAPAGNDAAPGTPAAPLRTIQRAADLAQPGDTITVHEGVYRERVSPPRGGLSNTKRIVYRAAPGQQVEIAGSEVVKNWVKVQDDAWKVTLPNSFFGKFNPYSDLIHGDWFDPRGRQHHTGAVYLDGHWLTEAAALAEVLKPAGAAPLWFGRVDKQNTSVWAQFKGIDPNDASCVEINVRQTVFYPEKTGINYLTVAGFILRHAATPWAPPTAEQIGLIGPHWSKGWIIENNMISHSDLLRDLAGQVRRPVGQHLRQFRRRLRQDHRTRPQQRLEQGNGRPPRRPQQHHRALRAGGHRRQPGRGLQHGHRQHHPRHPRAPLVLRRRDGGHQVPRRHRRADHHNHIYRTCRGLWLDWMAQGTRVSSNLFHDNLDQDLFVEVDHGPFLVDNNVFLSPPAFLVVSQGGGLLPQPVRRRHGVEPVRRPHDALPQAAFDRGRRNA